LSDRVPQEHKDVARETIEQGRKVLVEDYFPEDRRDQFLYRGKKVGLIAISGTAKLIGRIGHFGMSKAS
jgi:hypothetical protein